MAGNLDLSVNVDVNPALAALSKLDAKLQSIGKDFEPIFSKMTASAAGLSAAFVALGAATAAFADELSDLAQANETTISSVLALQNALQQSGGNADTAGKLFQSFSNQIDAANNGNLKVLGSFEKLGISMQDLGTLATDQLRMKVLKALAEIPDAAERNAKAMDFFGKSMVGVDIPGFVKNLEQQNGKYTEAERSIKAAGDAFDKVGSIVRDLKVAFAQTFEPVFRYIANLKISVEDLTVALKAAAAVLVVMTGAGVLNGLVKLVNLMKLLATVVSKNPLVTIVAALVSLGVSAATYIGLTKAMEEAQQDVNNKIDDQTEKTDKTVRSQENLIDVIERQKKALQEVNDNLQKNFTSILKKIEQEGRYLSLTADEKKIEEEKYKIIEQGENAKLQLKQKYEALDKDARDKQRQTYEDELAAIEKNTQAAVKGVEQRIAANQKLINDLKNLQSLYQTISGNEVKYLETVAKARIGNSGYQEQIDMEGKLAAITQVRAKLMEQVANVAETERAAAIAAITSATTSTDLLNLSYEDQIGYMKSIIDFYVQQGQISQQTADIIIKAKEAEIKQIIEGNQRISELNSKLAAEARTFNYGWNKAFREYSQAASNAAAQGEKIFGKMTQGLEDLIVKFVKTGKFEFKSFVQDMLETLLRSQLQTIFANIFNPDTGALGSIGKLFGIGSNTKGQSATNPMYVYDVSGGGGGLLSGGGTSGTGTSDSGSWFGGIVDSVSTAASDLWSSVSSIGSSIGDFFGGWFADGGTLGAGKWGIAGENGPELISGPASITPMGGGQNVTYNINAVDAASFKALVASDPGFIHSVAMMGAGTVPRRR